MSDQRRSPRSTNDLAPPGMGWLALVRLPEFWRAVGVRGAVWGIGGGFESAHRQPGRVRENVRTPRGDQVVAIRRRLNGTTVWLETGTVARWFAGG